jgi:preprotein translocase subunit SecD
MRRAGPVLILIIGVVALILVFAPGLTSPVSGQPIETKLGLDLQGGLRVEYQAQQVGDRIPGPGDMEVIRQIMENRVNASGVSEPLVTTQGSDRIVIELPGVSDPNAIRNLVKQTGRLDFVPLGQTQKQKGDTIDFITDMRANIDHDVFRWPVTLRLTTTDKDAGQVWASTTGFHGPITPPLTRWQELAQVLLMSNEFAFVD